MGSFKDFYDILKDLVSSAKKIKNQELISLALDLQEKYFELREENEELNQKLKELNEKINTLEMAKVTEKDIEYSERGFFILKGEKPKIPYCSVCWKKEHKLIPLSQQGTWYKYSCGNCKTNCVVMNSDGHSINSNI